MAPVADVVDQNTIGAKIYFARNPGGEKRKRNEVDYSDTSAIVDCKCRLGNSSITV